MHWIGLVGVVAFALAWIPQSLETIKAGRCDVNMMFLLLAALGSFSLMMYAMLQGDPVFSIVNVLTTIGALVNLFYKLFPRHSRNDHAPVR
ncbi:MAG: hypothetical protein C4326_01300 [Ignavibacteria bacterium]